MVRHVASSSFRELQSSSSIIIYTKRNLKVFWNFVWTNLSNFKRNIFSFFNQICHILIRIVIIWISRVDAIAKIISGVNTKSFFKNKTSDLHYLDIYSVQKFYLQYKKHIKWYRSIDTWYTEYAANCTGSKLAQCSAIIFLIRLSHRIRQHQH